jgi:epoxide hydrolase
MTDRDVRPFRLEVPQGGLDDLRERLAWARWPDEGIS